MKKPVNVTTTARETFSFEESCNLAWMVWKRFGRDIESGAAAWRRLLQNNCPDAGFADLVSQSPLNKEGV